MAKATGLGAMAITGAVAVPLSTSEANTVPLMVRFAVRAPVADGVNVKLTVQEELIEIVAPFAQVPVPAFAKLEAFAPAIVKYGVAKTCGPEPLFETVTVSGELVVPTF